MAPNNPPPSGGSNRHGDRLSSPDYEESGFDDLDVFGDPLSSSPIAPSDSGWVNVDRRGAAEGGTAPQAPYNYALASVSQDDPEDNGGRASRIQDLMREIKEGEEESQRLIEEFERSKREALRSSSPPSSTSPPTEPPNLASLYTPGAAERTDSSSPRRTNSATTKKTETPATSYLTPSTMEKGRMPGGFTVPSGRDSQSEAQDTAAQERARRVREDLERERQEYEARGSTSIYETNDNNNTKRRKTNKYTNPARSHRDLPPSSRENALAMHEDLQVRMRDGWTLTDNTFEMVPMDKRRKCDVPYPYEISRTFRAMSGLSGLQIAHNAPVNKSALDIANEHLWKVQHDEVRKLVRVGPPNGPCLWSGNEELINKMYENMTTTPYKHPRTGEYLFYTQMKAHPWVIWPLWVEDDFGKDYVTVLLYSEQDKASEDPPVYNQLIQYTIIDPRRARWGTKRTETLGGDVLKCDFPHARTERIEAALRDYLNRAGYDLTRLPMGRTQDGQLSSPMTVTHCSPMQTDECTSGERCFATVKELLKRIAKWYLRGREGQEKRPEKVFRHLCPSIIPYQFRVEMAGINAWILMATLDFNARITVESIVADVYEVVSNGKRRLVHPYDLAGPAEQPPLAPSDWLLPGEAEPEPGVGKPEVDDA